MTLEAIARLAEQRRQLEESYRQAIQEARGTFTVIQIAEAAGVSRQAVYKLTKGAAK